MNGISIKQKPMRQKTLFKLSDYGSEFGGSLLSARFGVEGGDSTSETKGKRKTRRPLCSSQPLKVVLRADITECGNLLRHRHKIENAFKKFSEKFGVKIYEQALVSNHIHFVARFYHRELWKKFIRSLTGTLSKQLKIKWQHRPWSRILAWGRALKTAIQYTMQNHQEATYSIPYQARPEDLKRTRQLLKESIRRRAF